MVWEVNEEEVFAVNPNAKVQVDIVGNEKNRVIIVDDFYKNPDMVRHLALNAPCTSWAPITYGFPMLRTSMHLNLNPVREKVSELALENWNYYIDECPPFMTNLCIDNVESRAHIGNAGAPHADKCVLAAVLYLNTPEECRGGTSFYRHKETGLESLPRHPFFEQDLSRIKPVAEKFGCKSLKELAETVVFAESQFQKDSAITDSNEHWELLKVHEMRYNRILIYEGKVFHAVYGKFGDFTDNYRVVQAMFWCHARPSGGSSIRP